MLLVKDKQYVELAGPEYPKNSLDMYKNMKKRDLIIFHRIATVEKQSDIFRDLADSMNEYEFLICPRA